MRPGVVGRTTELSVLRIALDAAAAGSGGVADIAGDAGIGKSRIIEALCADAAAAGATVWRAAPTRLEAALPWSGLALLFGSGNVLDDEVLSSVAPPAREQVRAATSIGDTASASSSGVALAVAALVAAASAADRPPLVVVLDDLQWFDTESAAVLSHALHGVATQRCLVVVGRRRDEAVPFDLRRLVPPQRHVVVDVSGLGVDELGELTVGAGFRIGRSELRRIHERTGGNPLHALEMARAIAAGTSLDEALRAPSLLHSVASRFATLPADTRVVVGAAALLADPLVSTVAAARPGVDALDALGAAEIDGLVRVVTTPRGDVVRFDHSLFAAAAAEALSTADRRRLHAVFATVVADPIERALHVARSGPGVDAAVATMLEAAGASAAGRGSVATAIEHLEASVAATDRADDDAVARRLLELARLQVTDGRHAEALVSLRAVPAGSGSVTEAMVAHRSALPTAHVIGFPEARDAARAALALAVQPDLATAARTAQLLAVLETFDSIDRGLAAARDAYERLAGSPGPEQSEAHVSVARMQVLAGEAVDVDGLLATYEHLAHPSPFAGLPNVLAHILAWTEHPRAEEYVQRLLDAATATGSRAAEEDFCNLLAALEVPTGAWQSAEAHLRRSLDCSPDPTGSTLWALGWLLASTGRDDEATRLMERAGQRTRATMDRVALLAYTGSMAWVRGDAAAAAATLSDVADICRDYGERSVRVLQYRRDLVEALVGTGRLVDARAVADELDADAERSGLDSALADAAAARGVVEAAEGHVAAARTSFAGGLKLHERAGHHYEAARTRLAWGAVERRAGRRRDARALLDHAAVAFAAMGASPWVRRCRAELDRLGGSDADGPNTLTPTEEQVAALVAAGKSNTEVAAALFVSVRTVESNLTRIYRKVGVRSRTELAARRV